MVNIDEVLRSGTDRILLQENDKILMAPYTYILGVPSKFNISKLLGAFNHWLAIPEDKLQLIHEITEMVYYSSVLLADIEDNSILRMGEKVAHFVYGLGVTINASTYASYKALDKLSELNRSETANMFSKYIRELSLGQGMDIYWRDTCTVPTEADYKVMAVRKIGALLTFSIGLMQLFSKNKEDFTPLIVALAVYFQILEDNSKMFSKDQDDDDESFCMDLTEGKFNLPIIHAIGNGKTSRQVLTIIRHRSTNTEVKKYLLKLLADAGSLKYTSDVLEKLDETARKEVTRLGTNPSMEAVLNELSSWGEQTKLFRKI